MILLMAGLRIMFTGHYHANDITSRIDGDKTLYDIETGSMVTAPIPYRIITIKGTDMNITTKYITAYFHSLPGGLDLASLRTPVSLRSP